MFDNGFQGRGRGRFFDGGRGGFDGGRGRGGRFGGSSDHFMMQHIPNHVMQMQMPIAAVSHGPMHPVIFAGHIGWNKDDEGLLEYEEEDGNNTPKFVFELNFNQQAHFLEGIHIVPMGISPPLGFAFQGQTAPEMAVRPFTLEIYARDIDTAAIKKVLSLTVNGGVQWMEIPAPMNSIAVDYLAIKGDFERLSLIIHGGTVDPNLLRESAVKLMENGLPIPKGFVSGEVEASDDAEYDSDEDGVGEDQAGDQGIGDKGGDRMARLPVPPPYVIEALTFPVNFFREKLKRRELAMCSGLLKDFFSTDCMSSPFCIISMDSMATLIDVIFSVDVETLSASKTHAQTLLSLASALKSCLGTAYTGPHDSTSNSTGTRDEFAVSLGDDVACVLVDIAQRSLTVLDVEACRSEYCDLELDEFLSLGNAVLEFCGAIALNEFTAVALMNSGGLESLARIIKQQPPLPPRMHAAALEIMSCTARHYSVAVGFFLAPTLQVNGYEALMSCLSSLSFPSQAVHPCKDALNWCAFVDSCLSLKRFCTHLVSDLEKIAQTVALYLASSGGGAGSVDSDSLEDDAAAKDALSQQMSDCSDQLHAMFNECKEKVVVLQGCLMGCVSSPCESDRIPLSPLLGDDRIALIKTLHESNIMASLVAIAALVHALQQHAAAIDWAISHSEVMTLLAKSSRAMLAGLLGVILTVDRSDLLIGARPTEAHLLWQYLAQEEHVLATQSLDELTDCIREGALSDKCQQFSAGSLGWAVFLSNYAMNIAQRAMLDADSAPAISDLFELSGFPCGASVVARTLSQFLAPRILGLLAESSTPESTSRKCLIMLKICLESDSPIVIRCMLNYWGRISVCMATLISSNKCAQLALGTRALVECGQGLPATAKPIDLLTMCRKDIVSAVKRSRTLSCSNLQDLEVSMRVLSQADESDLWVVALQSEEGGELLAGVLVVLKTATRLARGGTGWAADSSVSISGYDGSHFAEFLLAPQKDVTTSGYQSTQQKVERVEMAMTDAYRLMRVILTCLQLERDLLTMLRLHTAPGVGIRSEELLTPLLEANSYAHCLLGCNKGGLIGMYARRIASTVTDIMTMYCPPSPWSESCSLIPYLLGTAITTPRYLQSNTALISSLLPTSGIGGILMRCVNESSTQSLHRAPSAGGGYLPTHRKAPTAATSCSVQYLIRHAQCLAFQYEPMRSAAGAKQLLRDHRDLEDDIAYAWQDCISRPPVCTSTGTGKLVVVPFAFVATNPAVLDSKSVSPTADPLFLASQGMLHGAANVSSLVACGLLTASTEVHANIAALCHQIMVLTVDTASSLARGLVDALDNMSMLHMHQSQMSLQAAADAAKIESGSGSGGKSAHVSGDYEAESAHAKMLLLINGLCSAGTPCLVLVSEGVLLGLFATLHSSSVQLVTLALQAISTIYRVLKRLSVHLSSQAADDGLGVSHSSSDCLGSMEVDDPASSREQLLQGLIVTLQATAEGTVALLPAIATRFQNSSTIIAQVVLTINAFPPRYLKSLVDTLGSSTSTIQLEVLSIKLWLFFEDAFQAFTALIEAVKTAGQQDVHELIVSSDQGVEAITSAHAQLATASSALSAVTEIVVLAYAKNWIPLVTMNRSMRSAVSEPRKIALRYQRAYTMWSTDRKYCYIPEFLAQSSEDVKDFPLPPLRMQAPIAGADFDARHNVVGSSLRRLVEATRKYHEFVKGADGLTREEIKTNDPLLMQAHVQQLEGIDFANPFTSFYRPLPTWFALRPLATRASSIGASHYDMDALHGVVRRAIITGDETQCSIFDVCDPYIRLKAFPRFVDPQAGLRRRERRQKRRAARQLAVKAAAVAAAEAAKIAAIEVEEKRLQMEAEVREREQRERDEAEIAVAAQAAAAPQIALAGVPKHLLSKFNAAPLLPSQYNQAKGAGAVVAQPPPLYSSGQSSLPPPPLPPGYNQSANHPGPSSMPSQPYTQPSFTHYSEREKVCFEFQSKGSCMRGDQCRYSHSGGSNQRPQFQSQHHQMLPPPPPAPPVFHPPPSYPNVPLPQPELGQNAPPGASAGRGRGATLPAWMTSQQS